MISAIMIVVFTILFIGCGSKEPLTQELEMDVSMQGVSANIREDTSIGTLLQEQISLANLPLSLTNLQITLSGSGSEDFNITLVPRSGNNYIGKVALTHSLEGKGGTSYNLQAIATVDGENIGPVPVNIHIITVPNQTIVMLCDETNGTEPWISNGTETGTKPLGNFNPDGDSHMIETPVKMGSQLYFSFNADTLGAQIWESDGTPTGTKLFLDVNTSTTNEYPTNLTVVEDKLFFSILPSSLYVTNKDANAKLLKQFTDDRFSGVALKSFASYHDKLYFILVKEYGSQELWQSDGSITGTQFIQIIEMEDAVADMTIIANTLYLHSKDRPTLIRANLTSNPLNFETFYTFSNNALTIREMGEIEGKLFFITISSTEQKLYVGLSSDIPNEIRSIDFDFSHLQVLENNFLLETMNAEGEREYRQLWKSTPEGEATMIKELPCAMLY